VEHFEGNAETLGAIGSGSGVMASLAREHGIHIVGGVIERVYGSDEDEGGTGTGPVLHNTIVAYGPDTKRGPIAQYRKIHLSKVQLGPDKTSEGNVLTAGTELAYFDLPTAGTVRTNPLNPKPKY
jgi:predicted amidohydrolase